LPRRPHDRSRGGGVALHGGRRPGLGASPLRSPEGDDSRAPAGGLRSSMHAPHRRPPLQAARPRVRRARMGGPNLRRALRVVLFEPLAMNDEPRERYAPSVIEPKWQRYWDEHAT